MSGETVKLAIDGKPVEVPKGTTILQAAEKLGIHIPRYCYHPGLEIVGICRICQVEVKGSPKPVIACYMQAQDGMEVFTDTELVRRTRSADLEFLLLNHPIDCPICDTSGECDLQNYYMTDGKHKSRLRHRKINRKKKTRIGQQVVLDQERCILCSRCVRFLRHVSKTHELGFFGRGDWSYIDNVEGKTLDGNIYSGNIIDLCPVGALTDDDFRFKCRVWYLERSPSICPHCANGCNTIVEYNTELCWKNDGKRIMRIKPRFNPHVNDYWMCDVGRYNYDWAEQPSRIIRPYHQKSGVCDEITWDEALETAAEKLEEARSGDGPPAIGVVPSPWMTCEAAYLFRKLFVDGLGTKDVGFRKDAGPEGGDGLLFRNDPNPNRLGLELLGAGGPAGGMRRDELLEKAAGGAYRVLVVVEDYPATDRMPPEDLVRRAAEATDFVIVFASNAGSFTEHADLVLSVCPWSEDHGTWVNWRGRVQRLTPALPPKGYTRITVEALAMLASSLRVDLGEGRPVDTFARLAGEVKAFSGLTYGELGEHGTQLRGYSGTKRDESACGKE